MRKFFIYMLLLFAVSASAATTEIKWAKDFNSGIEQAKKINRPVLFVSSRHTCKFCVILDDTTFKDKRVIDELNKNFVSIISYSDENDYMPKELWQPGTPAIWFLFPNGVPMYQPLMGAVDADNFLKALAIIKDEYNKTKEKR